MTKDQKTSPTLARLANRPSTYLVYLAFFFVPMVFTPVDTADIVAAIIAVAVFLPLHFIGFHADPRTRIATIVGLMLICVATASFVNSHSVFFVYAAASAAFLRPIKLSTLVFVACAIVYLIAASVFGRHPFEMSIAMLLGIIVWVSCFSSAEALYEGLRSERARALDLQQASLIERERIARDLHDLLGHTLTLVSLKADLAMRLLDSEDTGEARKELASIQGTSREALGEVRAALSGLTTTTVARELENAQSALKAAKVELTINGQLPEMDPEQDTAFGLMLREAVTNIIRHSSASEAEIRFSVDDDVYSLEVIDNGAGANLLEGSGLTGLRRRLEGLGGMLSVSSESGVQLRALLPT